VDRICYSLEKNRLFSTPCCKIGLFVYASHVSKVDTAISSTNEICVILICCLKLCLYGLLAEMLSIFSKNYLVLHRLNCIILYHNCQIADMKIEVKTQISK
jgi:hypothetical protein